MKLQDLLNYGKKYLSEKNINDSTIIAKEIIEYVFNIKKEKIIIFFDMELNDYDVDKYKKTLQKISKRNTTSIYNKQARVHEIKLLC
ncbi:MAG: hypothetical protein J6A89_02315 [Clostridia bacterium]|nr:hypothetical protein [Clostridia bacterium]